MCIAKIIKACTTVIAMLLVGTCMRGNEARKICIRKQNDDRKLHIVRHSCSILSHE